MRCNMKKSIVMCIIFTVGSDNEKSGGRMNFCLL